MTKLLNHVRIAQIPAMLDAFEQLTVVYVPTPIFCAVIALPMLQTVKRMDVLKAPFTRMVFVNV